MSSASAVSASLFLEIKRASASASLECVGIDLIKNDAQARLGMALIRAFHDSSEGFIYFEPCTARSSRKPPDAVLCTKELGVVVIECKGYSPGIIERVQAGTLHLRLSGRRQQQNPLDQARDVMFDLKNATERKVAAGLGAPLFSYFVALPNYPTSAWKESGFMDHFPNRELLLSEDMEPQALGRRMLRTAAEDLRRTPRAVAITPAELRIVRGIFGDSALLNSTQSFPQKTESSLGSMIAESISSDKELSAEQRQISELEVGGFPRLVRGVAGSGKSVVLAIQLARYLTANLQPKLFNQPARKIAAICFNRCFAQLLKRKVEESYSARTHESLPENLHVTNLNKLMHQLSHLYNWPIRYIPIGEVPDAAARAVAYVDSIDSFAASQPELYDSVTFRAIFVDEGQDFEPEEYVLLQRLIRPDPVTKERSLIIFYDDAQNLYARKRPVWKELGIDLTGGRSRVMRECFRNTREIVTFAFNMLLGSQSENPRLVKTREFAGLAELRQNGLVDEVHGLYEVNFAEREGEWPIIKTMNTRKEELSWLVRELTHLIVEEEVEPHHLLVLCRSRDLCDEVRNGVSELMTRKIVGDVRCPSDKEEKDEFIFHDGQLTISTVKSAKGYEAQIVFMFGSDAYSTEDEGRAEFYVGATRAQLRLYVSGLAKANSVFQEAERLNARTTEQGAQ